LERELKNQFVALPAIEKWAIVKFMTWKASSLTVNIGNPEKRETNYRNIYNWKW
jgi:hypothetical protein